MALRDDQRATRSPFAGPGEIRARCRAIDWGATSLGPVERWPLGLRLAVRVCLDARSPMAVWAGPDLLLVYNDGYPPVLGAARHPWALGRPGREVWATIWDRLGPELARVMEGESTSHEDERFVLPRNGREEEAFFTWSMTPIQEDDGRVVGALNVFIETTERVRSLDEREARYRAVFENASDAILVTDPAGPGRVLSANPAACRLFGYAEEEFHGLPRERLLDPADPQLAVALRDRDARGGTAAALTYLRKDGSRFTGELRSTSFRDGQGRRLAVSVIRDVTERGRAERVLREREEALRESEQRLRVLVEHVSSGVALVDAAGRFTLFNQRFLRMFGLAAEATIANVNSQDWSAWQVLDAGGRLLEVDDHPVRKAARTRRPVRGELVGVRLPGGGALAWMLVSAAPLFDAAGEVEHLICTYHDITELKGVQEALVAANARLKEEDRRKNQFMAVLSHELRNPLAPIKNSLYVLARAAPGGEQATRARGVIERQVEQLARLVDDLLDVTRITRNKVQLQPRRLELHELVRRTLEDHRTLFDDAGVHLDLAPPGPPVHVQADGNRIAQVVGNLLANAVKFTARGGRVRVSVAADPAARQAVIRVSDTGAGIAPEMLERLFQPFTQADDTLDRAGGGLGLGLALVKGFVELHGGTVEATSAGLGRGAEFTVRLPLDASGEAREAPPQGGAGPGGGRRVLVIEDNADAAESLRDLLQLEHHDVEIARDGAEGVAKARALRPDVVLCDVGLPGMSGYEVARALRAERALDDTLLVAVTGYALPEDLQRAAEAGFDHHLPKPPSLERLAELFRAGARGGRDRGGGAP